MGWVSAEALTEEETPFGIFDRAELNLRIVNEARIKKGIKGERNQDIRQRAANGETVTAIAREYGLSRQRVYEILARR